MLEFQQAIAVESVVARKIKKQQVAIARSLGVLNVARKPGVMKERLTEEAFESFGGKKSILRFAEKYVDEVDRGKRTALAEQSTFPWWRKVSEIIPSIYVTGLISQIDSHLRNVMGYASMRLLTIPENFIAVGYGNLRTYLFKEDVTILGKTFKKTSPEKMALDEAIVGMSFEGQYWAKAWAAFKNASLKNQYADPAANKVITSPVGKRAFEYDFGNRAHEKFASKSIEYMGAMATISGRIMMAEDEFMKALA